MLGVDVAEANRLVAEFLREWLISVEGTVRPNVFLRYKATVEVHLIPGLGQHRLAQLSPSHVEAFLRSKASEQRPRQPGKPATKPLAPRTIQEIRTILSGALTKAQKWGYLERNVAALAEGPRVPARTAPLTAEQARTFLEAARGDPLEALFIVSLTTGLRQGEALGLRWDDIDLDGGALHVRRALSRVDGNYVLGDLKTLKSRRAVPLSEVAIAALREHQCRQSRERDAAKQWEATWGALAFCTGAAATLMLSQGIELKVIQEVLGHSTIAITANTYSHVVDDLKRDAARRMGALFSA